MYIYICAKNNKTTNNTNKKYKINVINKRKTIQRTKKTNRKQHLKHTLKHRFKKLTKPLQTK